MKIFTPNTVISSADMNLNFDSLYQGGVADDSLTSNKISSIMASGAMTSVGVTVAAQTVVTVALATTAVPHNYLCMGAFEFTTSAGTGCEFWGSINLDAVEKSKNYVNSNTGDYITPLTSLVVVPASSGNILFKVGETAGPRGTLIARSRYVVIDLGVA